MEQDKAAYFTTDRDGIVQNQTTAEEAREGAIRALEDAREESVDGWDESVTNICWGVVLGEVSQISCAPAPEGSEFDEIWDFGLAPVESQVSVDMRQAEAARGLIKWLDEFRKGWRTGSFSADGNLEPFASFQKAMGEVVK